MNCLRRLLPTAFALNALVSFAHADVITDWHAVARDYLTGPWMRGRTMMHVAQFDAVNATVGGYTPYALTVAAPGASPEAAAARAAYTVLTNITRTDLGRLNRALTNSLAAIPEGAAKAAGLELGRLAGETIIGLRVADNPELPITPPGSSVAGKWRPTPPKFEPGTGAQLRYQLPWTMRSQAQFRPPPPPALNSSEYAAELEEVRLLGATNSVTRTPDQSHAADWHDGDEQAYLITALPQRDLSLLERARLFALFYMAWSDATLAFLEAQYAYSFWRPITAIRNAANDGNDLTHPQTTWTPLWETPNHPEYPSGTCARTAAMIDVVIHFFGDNYSFTGVSRHTSVPRTFARPSAALEDAVTARIAAGGHFRTSCVRGLELGRQVAQNALRNFLRPVPRLAPGTLRAPGEFILHLTAGRSETVVLEASSDLSAWTRLQTNQLGTISHTTPIGGADVRFYRTVIAP